MKGSTRPGGFEITRKAFNICAFAKSASTKILDVGCGSGDTAAFLTSEYGFCVTGIDPSDEAVAHAKEKHPGLEFMKGDGQALEFKSLSFDCVLMECTLSLMPNPVEAIHEAFCVLKEGGYLIAHDLYIPHPSEEDLAVIEQIRKSKTEEKHKGDCGKERRSECTVNGALIMNDIFAALEELGFELILFEDRKSDLDSFAASLVFEGGSVDEYLQVKQDRSRISYFLLNAQKGEKR